jgi:hypothetical protein
MRFVRFGCLFAILMSLLVLAQSSRDQLANQPNRLPIAQQRHPAPPPNLSQMPQGAPFAQRRAGAFRATAPRRLALAISGLDSANALDYGSGGTDPLSVAVADVNGDGKPDLIVANYCASSSCGNTSGIVGVLLGNGDGTFQTVVTYASGGVYARSVAVADVNGDGKPDLILANQCGDTKCATSGAVGMLLGNGDGTFQAAATYDSGGVFTTSVAAADVKQDGKPDLLVGNNCASSHCDTDSSVGVLAGNGDGTFQAAVSFDSGGQQTESITVVDVNGTASPISLWATGALAAVVVGVAHRAS